MYSDTGIYVCHQYKGDGLLIVIIFVDNHKLRIPYWMSSNPKYGYISATLDCFGMADANLLPISLLIGTNIHLIKNTLQALLAKLSLIKALLAACYNILYVQIGIRLNFFSATIMPMALALMAIPISVWVIRQMTTTPPLAIYVCL